MISSLIGRVLSKLLMIHLQKECNKDKKLIKFINQIKKKSKKKFMKYINL